MLACPKKLSRESGRNRPGSRETNRSRYGGSLLRFLVRKTYACLSLLQWQANNTFGAPSLMTATTTSMTHTSSLVTVWTSSMIHASSLVTACNTIFFCWCVLRTSSCESSIATLYAVLFFGCELWTSSCERFAATSACEGALLVNLSRQIIINFIHYLQTSSYGALASKFPRFRGSVRYLKYSLGFSTVNLGN